MTPIEFTSAFEALVREHARALDLRGFDIRLSTAWAARERDHRILLRSQASLLTGRDFSDLSHPPVDPRVSVSISHCLSLGGLVTCDLPQRVGLDLEVSSRLGLNSVARVSSPGEIDQAPSPAHLWCAKEAAFKALLGPRQPAVISLVETTHWTKVPEPSAGPVQNLSAWAFEIVGFETQSQTSVGVALDLGGVTGAFFAWEPQT